MALGKRLINTGAAAADVACSTDSVQAFGADNAFSSNIALYQLDGNANDTTTNYNGTASNVTYATGKFGNAAVFNGSSKIVVNKNVFTNTNVFSLSIWFKTDGTVSTTQFLMDSTGGASSGFQFYINNSKLNFFNRSGVTNSTVLTSTTSVDNSSWHNAVITQNSSGFATMYIDGQVEVASTNLVTVLPSHNLDLHIGGYYTSTLGLDGDIDQLRIFDKAISEEDVATLYAETSSTASNTNPFSEGSGVALYTMDYDASEASGYYDGTPTNVEFGVGGQINYGARFNGSSSEIDLPVGLGASGDRARSFWINVSAFPASGGDTIYYIGQQGANDDYEYLSVRSNGTIRYQERHDSGGAGDLTIDSQTTISLNQWYNIIIVFDGLNRLMYINSSTALGNTGTKSTPTVDNSAYAGNLGSFRGVAGTLTYDGSIDQVRMFSKALNQTEVDTLYAEIACVYDSTTDIVNYPSGTTPVAYYKLDNSSEDFSTGGNDGTDTNIEYRFGRFGQAAVFNGSSSYINVSSFSFGSDNLSISLWIKPSSTQNAYANIIDFNQTYISKAGVFAIQQDASNTNQYQVWQSNGSSYNISNSVTLTADTWNHLVYALQSNGDYALYLNGTSSTSGSNLTASTSGVTETLNIGRWYNNGGSAGRHFNGDIDQVRIYSTALDADQVTKLYEEKPEVDTSNFKTVLYKGTSAKQYISNVGFDLDVDNGGDGGFVWVKARTGIARDSRNYDTVRGIYPLYSSRDLAEGAVFPIEYDANGFFFNGNEGGVNETGVDYVAWVWKGGGDAVNIGVNSITGSTPSVASDVSANTEAGFSIVKYTGNSTAGATVGHGLSSAPDLIIVKLLDSTKDWYVFSELLGQSGGEYQYLELNTTDNATIFASQEVWNGVLPTSDLFTLTAGSADNLNNNDYIAYCWHSVAGYSKIGTYSGNNNTNGPEITTGFKPSWIMIKRLDVSGHSWLIYDSVRSGSDFADDLLYANLSNSENPLSNRFEFKDTSFKILTNNASHNASGTDNFLYMAFK